MKNNFAEFILPLAVIVLSVALLNPFGWWMPGMVAMFVLAALLVIFCVFAVFVFREKPQDEREEQLRSNAGRAGFLSGAAVLMLAIVIQDLSSTLDPWLVYALIAMVVAKIAVRFYSEKF